MIEDAEKIIENLNNLPHYASRMMEDGTERYYYKASLSHFFASEKIIKMLFSKEACEEE